MDASGHNNYLSSKAQNDCLLWLQELVKKPKEGKRDWYLYKAQNKFKGLSERSFKTAWRDATKGTDWSRPGRPKK